MGPGHPDNGPPEWEILGTVCEERIEVGITGMWEEMEAILGTQVRHIRWRRARLPG